MASKGVQLDTEAFNCSICLDLLSDPVAIPCGHSYCMNCIRSFWDEEGEEKVYCCPQCRQRFTQKPVLVKNTMLAALVEELKNAGLQAASAEYCFAGPEDVACDFCTARKVKALKSCLSCLASYCEKHLQPHHDVAPLKKHKLVKPSKNLQENVCTRHNEVMKMFCRTDQECICYLCFVDKHKGHDAVSAEAEWAERQKEIRKNREKIKKRIQKEEEKVNVLQQEMDAIDRSADKTVKSSVKIFSELIQLIQRKISDTEQLIRSQQRTEVNRVRELQEKLKQEISELKSKDAELEQLKHMEDHNQLLQNYPSLSQLSESTPLPSLKKRPLRYFEDVTAAVSKVGNKLQAMLSEDWTIISETVAEVDILLPQPEPVTRDDFLKYACEITLDVNTAHKNLALSKKNRKVTYQLAQPYPLDGQRFTDCVQVLSRETLDGRCYWEVQWRKHGVSVAVAYKDMNRVGGSETSTFGSNDKSWALRCDNTGCELWYNNVQTKVLDCPSFTIGVYLNHRAGTLSFFSVHGAFMTLLYKVQTRFTQPLLAGLGAGLWFIDAEIHKLK